MDRILVFAGTTEGKDIADWLAAGGLSVSARVVTDYGTTRYTDKVDVQKGSLGGAEGIAEHIRSEGYTLVIDCTHPYAASISAHVKDGCAMAGVECIRIRRKDSPDTAGIVPVPSLDAAIDYLMDREGNILSTTGSKEVDRYTRIPGYRERVTVRVLSTPESVAHCAECGFQGRNLIAAQGPFSEEMDYAMIRQCDARYVVTKESGSAGGFEEKLAAARKAGAELVVITRPEDEGISPEDAYAKLSERFGIDPPSAGKRKVVLVGIGMGGETMTQAARNAIASADLIAGADRMVEEAGASGKTVLREYVSDKIISYLDSNPQYRNAAVLLSGDVGFYSGAKKIIENIDRGKYEVSAICGISTAVYLCSKALIPWQDAYLVSAHGKPANTVGAVDTHTKTFMLLNGKEGVRKLCSDLTEYGFGDLEMIVGCDLGSEDEKLFTGKVSGMSGKDYGTLCAAIVMNTSPAQRRMCIPDDEFIRGDAPMTKSEVRGLSVAKLRLKEDSVVYDVGAGTGSVTIEMALAAYEGWVYAIEKEDAAAELIGKNMRKFKAPNIDVVKGLAPEAMKDLPAPTHAFIGGSSGNLKEIVQCLLDKNPDVRMVITSVTIETMGETASVIKDLGLVEEEIINVSVTRTRKVGRYHLMDAQNPVYIAVVRGR